tara:strand:- start:313 stop:435 length:123 start_codon:yes stop_codon:yes gene_type:complete
MDKYSIARIRVTVLTKEKKRIDKELKHFKDILKEQEKKTK